MLPAEIIDFIFSFLQRDQAALKSCSAAHPFLSPLAERHLFVHTTVHLSSQRFAYAHGFRVDQLGSYLSEKPYLANHIRSITIDAQGPTFPFSRLMCDELATLLPSITHSEELLLRNVSWPRLSNNCRSALMDFLRTTHMKGISLQNADDFPLNLLDDSRNIKNLKIYYSRCSFIHYTALPIPTSIKSLSLVNVSLDEYTTWAHTRLNSLTSLHAKLDPFPNLSPIFNICSKSLTTLTLEIDISFQTAYRRGIRSSIISPLGGFPFNLSSLVSLELITVHAAVSAHTVEVSEQTSFTSSCDSSLLAITQLVSSAGSSLKRAVLNLDCTVGVAPDLRDAMEWGALVQLCDSLAHLRVDLCICAFASRVPISFVEVVDSLVGNDDLSRLVEWGSLVIKPFEFSLDF